MADRIAPLRTVLKEFEFGQPSLPLISTITGREVSASDDIAALLGAQLTSPVRFAQALGAAADGADLLVETGPGQTLAALAAGCCHVPAVSLATGRWDDEAPARAAAALFAAGAIASVQPLLTGRPPGPSTSGGSGCSSAAPARPCRVPGSGGRPRAACRTPGGPWTPSKASPLGPGASRRRCGRRCAPFPPWAKIRGG